MIVVPTVMWKEVVGPGLGGSMWSSVLAMLSLRRRRAIQDDIAERHSETLVCTAGVRSGVEKYICVSSA
ncbi:hypothetical protein FKM82_022988 [Ascaphus truei]